MPLHPQAVALLEQLASLGDPPLEELTPGQVRALRRSRLRPPTIALPEIRDVDAGGVRARLYRPSLADGLGLVVYFHGGGFVLGDLDTHDHVARALAVETGHAVLSVDYRLAPEHPFPASVDDAVTAARWVAEHADELGCDDSRLAITGDSAGGTLAAVVTQTQALPYRFQVLLYPVTDARCGSASYDEFRDGPFLTAAGMGWYLDHYLSGASASLGDPLVSPLLASDEAFAASPPTLVITAELDVLRDEGEAYAARLAAADVPVTLSRYDGTFHAFVTYAEFLDDARAALAETGRAVAAALA